MTNPTMPSRLNKRRVMATLLTVAATMLVQTASASVITNNARGVEQYFQQQPRDIFENADVKLMPMAKRESASESAEHASWISKALILAGTYSPTVSTIAGKATTTSTVKTTSTTLVKTTIKTTSTIVKTISATAKVTSTTAKTTSTTPKTTSTTAKTTSSTAKTTSTTPKTTSTTAKTTSSTAKTTSTTAKTTAKTTSTTSLKVTASAKPALTTAKVTSTSKIITTGNFPTAGATSAKTTSTTAKPKTQTWSWAAAAYGCGTASPSGKALLCYATGTAQAHKRASEATAAPSLEREDQETFSLVKRADATNTPDFGWLDTVVGAVPYRSGDLVSSIVWIVMTLLLIPLFVIRLLRRSSLIAHVLICVFFWICAVITAFGIRAWMAASTPTTKFIIAENVILQALPCLLLEPLFSLLAMYSAQGEVKSGVPSVCMLLRAVNLAALALFAVTAAFTGIFMDKWDQALMSSVDSGARNAFPADLPAAITRLCPIIGSFMMLAVIAGGLLMIPVARGANGSMRPGAFLAALFTLVGISVTYRILQTLHARDVLASEADADSASNMVSTTLLQLASTSMVKIADIAPPGMFSSEVSGIAWSKLQSAMASRGASQSPLIFNLVYVFPMWLQVFLLFFVHAPAGDHSTNAKVAALEASA